MVVAYLDSLRLAASIDVCVMALTPFRWIVREAGVERHFPGSSIIRFVAGVNARIRNIQFELGMRWWVNVLARIALPTAFASEPLAPIPLGPRWLDARWRGRWWRFAGRSIV